MLDWLKKRLTRIKRGNTRWAELAEALESFWVDQFDPEYLKALAYRSIYTADNAGRLRMLAELGQFYERDLDERNMAVALAMRKLELKQKETTLLINSYIQRHGINETQWEPLYALRYDAYGTRFYTAQEMIDIGEIPGGYTKALTLDGTWKIKTTDPVQLIKGGNYLTSRGRITCNLATVERTTAFLKLSEFIREIKPLHIVYDGVLARLSFEMSVRLLAQSSLAMTKNINQPYAWPASRLDGSWKISTASPRKLGNNIEARLTLRMSSEASISRHEKLKPGLYVDGSWKVGRKQLGIISNAQFFINGSRRAF